MSTLPPPPLLHLIQLQLFIIMKKLYLYSNFQKQSYKVLYNKKRIIKFKISLFHIKETPEKIVWFWLVLLYIDLCCAHSQAWNRPRAPCGLVTVHHFGFQPCTTLFCFTVAWHFWELLMASSWPLHLDKNCTCMAVDVQDSHRDL